MERSSSEEGGETKKPRHLRFGNFDQRFQFGPWLFDISKAQAIVDRKPRPAQPVPVEVWAGFYGLTERQDESASLLGPRNLDRAYAVTTDLTEPLLIATMRNADGARFSLLVDGVHRLYHAYVDGVAELSAHVLTIDETLAIRIDDLAGGARGGRRA